MLTVRFTLLGIGVPVLAMCTLAGVRRRRFEEVHASAETIAESESAAPEPDSANDAPTPGPDAGDEGSTPDIDAESDATTPDAEPDATLPAPDGSTPVDILDAGPTDAAADVVEETSTSGTAFQGARHRRFRPRRRASPSCSATRRARLITTAVTNGTRAASRRSLAARQQVYPPSSGRPTRPEPRDDRRREAG